MEMVSQNKDIKYFLYARKSSDSEDRQVQSIDDQIKRLKELSEIYHFQIKEIFCESRSAKLPENRPIFNEMIKRIEKGEANGILCWQINRLSRNPLDSGRLSWLLQKETIKSIQTIDRQFTPEDNVVVFNVESSIANQYIIDLKKNSMRGMQGKAERGWLPSMPPIGYINDKSTGEIVFDPERIEFIKRIWKLMLSASYSPMVIKKLINEEGFLTKRFRHKGGNKMSTSLFYRIFSNVFYTGYFKWNGVVYKGKHPPIITMEQFDQVQLMLKRKINPKPNKLDHTQLYSVVFKCPYCSSSFTPEIKTKLVKSKNQYKTYFYYKCTKKKCYRTNFQCNQKPISHMEIDTQINDYLNLFKFDKNQYAWYRKLLSRFDSSKNHEKEKSKINAKINAIEDQISRLIQMRYKDLIDDSVFKHEHNNLLLAKVKLRNCLEDISNQSSQIADYLIKLCRVLYLTLNNLEKMTCEQKRLLLLEFGSNHEIKDKNLYVTIPKHIMPLLHIALPVRSPNQRIELYNNQLNQYYSMKSPCAIRKGLATLAKVRTILKEYDELPRLPDINKDTPESLAA
ncbi:MAG TPA: recombinase family protein [Bacteroidia bacterium]|nr:recombinase family protein [Bacteroidia bacterium]